MPIVPKQSDTDFKQRLPIQPANACCIFPLVNLKIPFSIKLLIRSPDKRIIYLVVLSEEGNVEIGNKHKFVSLFPKYFTEKWNSIYHVYSIISCVCYGPDLSFERYAESICRRRMPNNACFVWSGQRRKTLTRIDARVFVGIEMKQWAVVSIYNGIPFHMSCSVFPSTWDYRYLSAMEWWFLERFFKINLRYTEWMTRALQVTAASINSYYF